ncbi:MAG: hypothetical protein WDZ77_02455 [Candidatus Pacearchaeota archaeon]
MKVDYKNKKLEIPVHKVSSLGEITGLMFRTKNTKNLAFMFGKKTNLKIHSFFVFFNFLAVWLDEKNKVLDFKIVRPFTFAVKSKNPFQKLIEIPMSEKNSKIVDFFVGRGKV